MSDSPRLVLRDLSRAAFEHPMDRRALDTLRRAPGLDLLFKKLSALGFEKQVRLFYTADSLRLSGRQCPRIQAMLTESSRVLDMQPPELYLLQTPQPNAMAIGMDRFTIVLTSGLLDLLDEDELRWVIGHELGHIKSGHMLYRSMAIFLSVLGLVAARNLPFVNLLSQALLYALYDWSRKSELTADRAGLLAGQDPAVPVRALLKLAGGNQIGADELDVDEFLRQADDYEDMDSSLINVFFKLEMTRYQTHPFPALRAREISRWSRGGEYQAILRGEYARASRNPAPQQCEGCGAVTTNPTFAFCPECGGPLNAPAP